MIVIPGRRVLRIHGGLRGRPSGRPAQDGQPREFQGDQRRRSNGRVAGPGH